MEMIRWENHQWTPICSCWVKLFSQLEPMLSSSLPIKGCVIRTVLGLSARCKNRGSSIGESCEDEDVAFSDVVALLSCSGSHCCQWRIFLEKGSNFLRENWEKVKKNLKNPRIWEFALIPYNEMKNWKTVFSLMNWMDYTNYIYWSVQVWTHQLTN